MTREFWIKQCDYIPDRAMATFKSAQCTAGCSHIPIHVREVVPIDWEKIWLYVADGRLSNSDRKLIQELVEKELTK